jgi:antirestriction protein ArdC
MSKTTQNRQDVYAVVTVRIVEQLEAGVRPWHQPWQASHPAGSICRPLRSNGVPYRGINVLVLWLTGFDRGYASPLWLTFQQAKELDACVRKGEQGTKVVYANTFEKKTCDESTGDENTERIPFLKSYTVFNAEQIEGLPAHYYAPQVEPKPHSERLDDAEAFFENTEAETRHGGTKAFYSPSGDFIQLPDFDRFENRESYYAVRAHEMIHWTKHAKRIDRNFETKRFGDEGYAIEELVAELGSAFLAADLGLTPEVMPDHASYMAAWLKVLKDDDKAIFTAAAHAEKAAAYLHAFQPHQSETASK